MKKNAITLEGGTYEIIQNRLQNHKSDLVERLQVLNTDRKDIFGAVETKLIANDRINTENSCIARDIVSFGNICLFGYNVHFGLRSEIKLADVFSVYKFHENRFQLQDLTFINQEAFVTDFKNLYKYYRNTFFTKFLLTEQYLYMVFQIGEEISDIKAFKWLVKNKQITYIDNRSDHEYKFPNQHEFNWQEVNYDNFRKGAHPHVSILDKVFVETIGGDLTIKIEDNSQSGLGIYAEPVDNKDQTLDDGQYRYADLGNLTVLEITPYLEEARYFVYNHKVQEVARIQSIKDTAVLLPDDQGLIFPEGYYLQTGTFKKFDRTVNNVKFQKKVASPNGEDFLYVFYEETAGDYVLMHYNIIEQNIQPPIICNGFTLLENGELSYFKSENEANKHHVIQIWQTPFSKTIKSNPANSDSLLYKIGNKDIVKAMAECQELITLLNKEDNYDGLYNDIAKQSIDIVDSYYWISEKETANLSEPLSEINSTANSAIDEFEKVVQLKKIAAEVTENLETEIQKLFDNIKHSTFNSIDDFVQLLTRLRGSQGNSISLKETRYINIERLDEINENIKTETERISRRCITFLLNKKALAPYQKRIQEKNKVLADLTKVIEGKALEASINQISADLELLIDIVNNLDIEDTSHSTTIIDNISLLFAEINQLKASVKRKVQSLNAKESKADFIAQLKLFDQSIINFIDIANTPEKCEEYLTKLSVQLEELEGKFADFDEYITEIINKREEVYSAFENRKNTLIEARNKKGIALQNASERILKSIHKKAATFKTEEEIHGYFASDIMVNKLHNIIEQLQNLEETGKAETLQTNLKSAKEEVLRKLKDSLDLYEDGDSVIKLGKHKFGVNKQTLDLNIVNKNGNLFFHLSGTDFHEKIENEVLNLSKDIWNQDLISENEHVYRSEFLAYKIYQKYNLAFLLNKTVENLVELVKQESSENYSEGYVKGVHDLDAAVILKLLIQTENDLQLLQFTPDTRANAQLFWNQLENDTKQALDHKIKATGAILEIFPASKEYLSCLEAILEIMPKKESSIADYLFQEIKQNDNFTVSQQAFDLKTEFVNFLKTKEVWSNFEDSLNNFTTITDRLELCTQWLKSYCNTESNLLEFYIAESVVLLLFNNPQLPYAANETLESKELRGAHSKIIDGLYSFNYFDFMTRLTEFNTTVVKRFTDYKEIKKEIIADKKRKLKLNEFKPKVLSSFVRNKLINQVYLPLFGDNLSKQLGTVGQNKRTDRMGMLLLISPPGYGKTTLMEYISERLGLVFMKINGPAIGHEITSVDPMAANNSATKQELEKLNLAFEMGNNVMLYLDDIQHCNPEFLQKFISLADGQRKIEGVYKGETKTYDFKDKKFCVIMAGNPYTESGDKFRIPDMLTNRADIYNLGDVIGETENLFKLSLIENALTSNDTLRQLSSKNFDDLYTLINHIEQKSSESIDLKGNHSPQEINDYISVLEKVITLRNTVVKVNEQYIKSAATEDAYRTEPGFKLQGSYRDMGKLTSKVVPIMNENELNSLLLSHYESESQTLTSAAEANLLKYKEMTSSLSTVELQRWENIKETFVKNNKLKGFGNQNEMAQVLQQLMDFSENLEGIKDVLKNGFEK
jgi:hypothetical protein